MLDIKYIRENAEKVQEGAHNKGIKVDISQVLELDKKRREMMAQTEQMKAEQMEERVGWKRGSGISPTPEV